MKIHEHDFEDQEVTLDFHEFTSCSFKNCKIQFHGLGKFDMDKNCSFSNCGFGLVGPAQSALEFLRYIYKGGDTNTKKMVEDYLAKVTS